MRHKHVDVAPNVTLQSTDAHVENATNIRKIAAEGNVILSPDVIPSRADHNAFSCDTSTM